MLLLFFIAGFARETRACLAKRAHIYLFGMGVGGGGTDKNKHLLGNNYFSRPSLQPPMGDDDYQFAV